MVTVVPTELQGKKKPEGPQALEPHEGQHSPCYPKAFPKNTILYKSRTSELDYLPANVVPRNYPVEYTPLAFTNIDSVKSNIVRGNYKECAVHTKH